MARWSYFLLLTLILGALEVKAQADEEDEESSESEESSKNGETETTFTLTKDFCIDGHESSYLGGICCGIFLESDDHIEFCNSKLKTYTDLTRQTIEDSKYTECIFNRWNYIKGRQNLNFDQIKADAAKLGDPFKEKFMVDMYKICGRQAKVDIKDMNNGPESRLLLKFLHKPYFWLVFICTQRYTSIHQCPYFRYGSDDEGINERCVNYTQQCEELLRE